MGIASRESLEIAAKTSAKLKQDAPLMESSPRCPICAEPAPAIARLEGWGHWCSCAKCELEFADPMKLPERPEEMFGRAYEGGREDCGMEEFAYRLSIRSALLEDPKLWFFNPGCIEEILTWLKSKVRPGATVLDLGCGPGFFLHTLKREGYNPVGLDVALPAVELNRSEGFKVWHGTLDTMPKDWVTPDAIVSLFMIHHLDDPLAFFKSLIARWPMAPVAIAEYGRDRAKPRAAAFPPRTLSRWTRTSLEQVIGRAGYNAHSVGVRSTGSEHTLIRPIRFLMRRTIKVPGVYRMSKRIQRRILPKVMGPLQQEGFSVIGFGEPPAKA
jgi:SAM-dependent methyltransferase